MRTSTVWLLLVLVLALGAGILWQLRKEQSGTFDVDRPLFPDLVPERLTEIRVDYIERGLQMRMVRDEQGTWQIVDPINFPAEPSLIERLMEVIRNRATTVPAPDLASLKLSPPRAVLELTESLPAGPRMQRVEIGIKDLDGRSVFVRRDGVVLRTLLNLDTTLERDLPDWRRRAILPLDPERVIEVHRSGSITPQRGAAPIDLALDAGSDVTGWRSTAPFKAALDPGRVGAMIAAACTLSAKNFVDDDPATVGQHGMNQPDVRLELITAQGVRELLKLIHEPAHQTWLVVREGSPHVFRVDDQGASFLCIPAKEMLDKQPIRGSREAITRVRLVAPGSEILVERKGALWQISGTEAGRERTTQRADERAVADLLGVLESTRLLEYEFDTAVTVDPVTRSIHVTAAGVEQGGELGEPFSPRADVKGVLFRRTGDDVIALAEERLAKIADVHFDDLCERDLVKLPELGIGSIELTHGGVKRKFVRGGRGRWSPEGVDTEAPREFLKVVDRVLSLRAQRLFPPMQGPELADPVEVVITDGGGKVTRYTIGRATGEEIGLYDNELRRAEVAFELHRDLAAVFAGQ